MRRPVTHHLAPPGRHLAYEHGLEEPASVRDRTEGEPELHRRDADALTERSIRRLDLVPGPALRSQHAGRLAGQRQTGRLAESEAAQSRIERGLADGQADLQRADVRAAREDLRRGQPVVE